MCITMLNSFDQSWICGFFLVEKTRNLKCMANSLHVHTKGTLCIFNPVSNSYMITSGMQKKPGWFSDGRVLNMQMVGLKTLSHYSLYGARVVVRQLNKVCCVDWSIVNYNSETMAPICLPSVYLMLLTSRHTRDKISQTFPSVFAHWNQSSDKGLGMRLSSVHYVWTVHRCIHTSSSMSYILRYVLTWFYLMCCIHKSCVKTYL